jgi:hypothetical protein
MRMVLAILDVCRSGLLMTYSQPHGCRFCMLNGLQKLRSTGCSVLPHTRSTAGTSALARSRFLLLCRLLLQVLLDTMEAGKRFVDFPWKNWGDIEEGGVAKPSLVLAAAAKAANTGAQ